MTIGSSPHGGWSAPTQSRTAGTIASQSTASNGGRAAIHASSMSRKLMLKKGLSSAAASVPGGNNTPLQVVIISP